MTRFGTVFVALLAVGCVMQGQGELGEASAELGLCGSTTCNVVLNEVESSGGVPGDWVELINLGATAADVSGWHFRDNDASHDYVLPAGSVIAAGGRLVLDEGSFGFGLGSSDSARIFDTTDTLVDSYTWSAHAATTYGRCDDATGAFTTTVSSTKSAPNDCAFVVINEVESNGGVPGDWVELFNRSGAAFDLSGYRFKDNDDSHNYVIPVGTSIAAGGYLTLEEAQFGFGLGAADAARLFTPSLGPVASFSWTAHAATTYGRCPNGTGAFVTSTAITKGAANDCGPPPPPVPAWPGLNDVRTVDPTSTFGGNMSDLFYEPAADAVPNTLWAVRNAPSQLFRNVRSGALWAPAVVQTLRYPTGTGSPDAEGVTRGSLSSPAIYVAAERNNDASGVSRMSILRFDTSGTGAELVATHEWNVTSDLPVSGANTGLEAITFVPDAFLVANGFYDEAVGHAYDPSAYPDHEGGLFFVGHESTGLAYAYALNHSSGLFVRVATMSSGAAVSKALYFDRETGYLWSACGPSCGNQVAVLAIDLSAASSTFGRFVVIGRFAAPTTMPNFANEGIAIAPESECAAGQRPFYWADDAEDDGHALRADTIPCGPFLDDADHDGVRDGHDNCLGVSNSSQSDSDGDGAGDACDGCPFDAANDADADGVCGDVDNCPAIANDQADADGDGLGDPCDDDDDGDGVADGVDNCPMVSNPDQADTDGTGGGDACDDDDDGDDVADGVDNCPSVPNADQADFDGDGGGDACDVDDDGDGALDGADFCPHTAPGSAVVHGCSIDQLVPCTLPPPQRWRNHGAYVSAHAAAVAVFVAAGLITPAEGGRLQSAAARSACGR